MECQVNVKSRSELDIGGRETCLTFKMFQVNGRWVLSGIVSWGLGCGEKDVPGVYVEVRIIFLTE